MREGLRRLAKGRTLIVALGLTVASVTSCEAVIGADFGDVQSIQCNHAAPPARPTVQNAGGTEEVVVAITTIDTGDHDLPDGTPAYRGIGFDLDGVCTNQGQRPSCAPHAWAMPEVTDGVDGIDNGGGALMHAEKRVFGIAPFTSKVASDGIRNGTFAPLAVVRIRGYNLRVIDDEVEVDWYVPEAHGVALPPRLDGTDVWPIWEGSVADGVVLKGSVPPAAGGSYPVSLFRDPHAYVTNYTLVARLPAGTPVKLSNVPFALTDVIVALNLAYDPLRVVSGVLGARLSTTELFKKMPQLTQAFKIGFVCKSDPSYSRIKGYFCAFVESHVDGRNEPDAPCDAVSFGMRFETTTVRLGNLTADPVLANCPPETDPATDSCITPVPVN